MFGTLSRQMRPRLTRGVSQALAEPMAWNQAPVQITTLPNGLRVASKETFGEVASVGVFLNAGVRDETPDTIGATCLFEKLALKGTATRSQDALQTEVASIGGELSVHGGREQSYGLLSCFASDLKQGFDIVADVVGGQLADGSLEKNKHELLRELEEGDQPTRAVIEDRLHLCAFRDTSLGFSAIGPFEGIEGLTQAHVENWKASATAEKTVVAVAGPVSHSEVVAMVEGHGRAVPAGGARAPSDAPYFCGAELVYRNDEMGPTAYMAVGWESVPWKSGDAVTFMVMQHILGSYKKNAGLVPGNISGNRTINAVANKMSVGCADEFEAFNCFYKDTGIFGFYAACDEVAVEHCLGELMFGINLMSFSVTDEEVARGKRELKIALFGGSGSTESACLEVGKQVLAYGRGIPPAEMILRIDAIDAEEVKRVAWQYLNDKDISATALGPLHGWPTYVELRRQTTMHRY